MKNSEMQHCKICPHCGQEFQNINPKVFSNHVRWCKKNPDRDRLSGKSYHDKQVCSRNKYLDNSLGESKEFVVICAKCGKSFLIKEREKKFPSKKQYFCSISCANSREKSKELKSHLSLKMKRIKEVYRKCPHCEKEFLVNENSKKRFCSISCARKYAETEKYKQRMLLCKNDIEKEKLAFFKYRQDCQFKFSLREFPLEFDSDLILKYGWYKAKNHGNNLTGVSRDHLYSVSDGFKHGIPPEVISHPANCKLVKQFENASKGSKSSISIDDLYERIRKWNEKYSNKIVDSD